MAYVPTTFVDRSAEFPNRRKLTAVSGQADTFDVARAEGTVFAEGTKPDAANLNAEFGKIKTETDSINTSLNGFRFGVDDNGNYGYYKVGADTVSPFKSMIELGIWNPNAGNFSADISAYGNVTPEDVYVVCDSVQPSSGSGYFIPLKTINGNTLTVSNGGTWTPSNSGLIVFLLV